MGTKGITTGLVGADALQLAEYLLSLPEETRVVTDVGQGGVSGWGDLCRAVHFPDDGVVELVFE